jgi:hypothetical protein
MVLTFHAVCLTLIFVKTQTVRHAADYLAGIAGGGWEARDSFALVYVIVYAAIVVALDFPCWWRDSERPVADDAPAWRRGLVYGLLLVLLAYLGEMEGVSFVYFQF